MKNPVAQAERAFCVAAFNVTCQVGMVLVFWHQRKHNHGTAPAARDRRLQASFRRRRTRLFLHLAREAFSATKIVGDISCPDAPN
jgi:hypothetical protein